MFDKFIELIRDIEQREFEVARSRGALSIQQTQRNNLKTELMNALYEGFEELGDEAGVDFYFTADGIILEIDNEHVRRRTRILRDKENEADVEGYISMEFNLKIKNLDYDAETEEYIYQEEQAEKKAKTERREKEKKAKIKRDAELRAAKARLRERKLEEAMARNKEENEG